MIFELNPDPMRVGQVGSLRIALDQHLDGYYWFRIDGARAHFSDADAIAGRFLVRFLSREENSEIFAEITADEPGAIVVLSCREEKFNSSREKVPQHINEQFNAIAKCETHDSKRKVGAVAPQQSPTPQTVALVSPEPPISEDQLLWRFIETISRRLRFDEFCEYANPKLPTDPVSYSGQGAYNQLKKLAEEFVAHASVPQQLVMKGDPGLGPAVIAAAMKQSYVSDIHPPSKAHLGRYPYGYDPVKQYNKSRGDSAEAGEELAALERMFPLLNVGFTELLYIYWIEEGMLIQTMNRIVARFQNRRSEPAGDPLLRCNINPLMPMRSFLWSFAEDEKNRLTVRRRAAEYEYEYGLRLRGRAVPHSSTLSERRSQFLEAFHRLLHACVQFYREHDDKTIDADAFPLLSNLQEVHLILARGAHNQFSSLASTARAELLTMQWILAQPEMHEFLGGPTMMPYEEPWMERVDTMKTLQGWSETSVTHFYELAVQGEQLLLSIRHGRWNESTRRREHAANWALVHRNPVQRYIASLETVLGVDLKTSVDATMPSELLVRRLRRQRTRA